MSDKQDLYSWFGQTLKVGIKASATGGTLAARSNEEAIGKALTMLLTEHPVSAGWSQHSVDVVLIPLDAMRFILGQHDAPKSKPPATARVLHLVTDQDADPQDAG